MIYPIAEQLEQLMESFTDPETGELIASEEEMQTAIEQLQIDFDAKIVDLRNEYINRISEAEAIKAERAKLMISVAHPDHREELDRAAFERFGPHFHFMG